MVLLPVTSNSISRVVNAVAQSTFPFAKDNNPRSQAKYLPSVPQGIADCVINSPTRVGRGEYMSRASGPV